MNIMVNGGGFVNKVLIVLASSTSAFSVKTLLEKRYKIQSRIIQAPAALATLGCAYSLELDSANLKTAMNLIKVSGMSVRGVYNADSYEKIY